MKTRNLVILIIVTAILVGWAYVGSRTPDTTSAGTSGRFLLPALQDADTLNRIEKIVIQTRETNVVFQSTEKGWVAPNKYGFPVDFGRLQKFVRTVSDLKIGQSIAADRKQLEILQLIPPGSASNDTVGTALRLEGPQGAVIASMIIGKERVRKTPGETEGYPDGRYVTAGDTTCIITDTLRELPENEKAWFDDAILNVAGSDITEISVATTNAENLVLRRPDAGGDFTLAGLTDKEELDTAKVNSLSGLLSWLNFADIADPKLTDAQMGLDKAVIVVAKTAKGPVYTLRIGAKVDGSDDRYATVSAAYTPPPVTPKPEVTTTNAVNAAVKEQEDPKLLAQAVATLNAKVRGWAYVVKSYKVDGAFISRATLVKAKEVKKEEAKDEKSAAAPSPTPPTAVPPATEVKK